MKKFKVITVFSALLIFTAVLNAQVIHKKGKGKSACTAGKTGICKTWGNKGFQCDPSESADCGGTTIVLPK